MSYTILCLEMLRKHNLLSKWFYLICSTCEAKLSLSLSFSSNYPNVSKSAQTRVASNHRFPPAAVGCLFSKYPIFTIPEHSAVRSRNFTFRKIPLFFASFCAYKMDLVFKSIRLKMIHLGATAAAKNANFSKLPELNF